MNKEGLVTSYLSEESSGPARKYYQLTKLGHKRFDMLKEEWTMFVETTKMFLEESHE